MCWVISDKTRSRLLKQADLTLSKAMDICRADKAALTQIKSMSTKPTGTASLEGAESLDLQALKARRSFQPSKQQKQCSNCGGRHLARQKCPATGSQCYKCGRQNAWVCRSGTQPLRQKLHKIHEDQEASSEEELLITATENEAHRKDWSATLTINDHSVAFKIDTGAQCNVISYSTYSRISRQPLMKSHTKL